MALIHGIYRAIKAAVVYKKAERVSMTQSSYYITTPIYYVNAQPHLGTAYTTLIADVQARFMRKMGRDVFFLTGLDEHGEKIANTAAEKGMTPLEWCDAMVHPFKETWKQLDITFDDFIRTTEDRHTRAVQKFLQRLYDNGYLYQGEYDGWYCTPCETYYTETQVRHHNEGQGTPDEHLCPDCNRPLHRMKEKGWFFKLSEFEQPLLEYYRSHPNFIQPLIRRNEIESFVASGLRDLSISRQSFDWGIRLPFDDQHVAYVWVDALVNYLTAIGYGDDEQADTLEYRWPAQLHLVGKDIIRFHACIWPAMLMAAGLPIPEEIFVHGFLLTKGEKMSKSRGNAIAPADLINVFGVDAYRYYFMTDVQPGADGSISIERMAQVYNADLANSWGNLCSRALNMTKKYFDGAIPSLSDEYANKPSALSEKAATLFTRYRDAFTQLDYGKGAQVVAELVAEANLFIEQQAPWTLAKDESKVDELAYVLYHILESMRIAAHLYEPLMPHTSAEVFNRLGIPEEASGGSHVVSLAAACGWGQLPSGRATYVGDPLFMRLDASQLALGE